MSPDRWDHVRRTFFAALERPPAERARFVDESCAGDPDLRRELDSLLASHDQAGSFLETPAYPPIAGAETASLPAGSRLGPYEIAAAIGSGGMGEVYRATDARLGREVAIKVLPREMATDPHRRRRFELEARAASALNHANIVAVYDAGLQDGVPFLVTELLDGQSLSARLTQGPLPVRKALECAAQAARGLAAAHERGIVHRDLKPANLFLTAQGQVKILDFGLAKLSPPEGLAGAKGSPPPTTPGLVLGTVGYMSPEQVRGEEVDARSDQFSLGCVLYELLAGTPPFRRPTMAQTMAAVLESEPAPIMEASHGRVPQPVAWITERCLAKDPQDRYGSTADLARDLELALSRLSELSLPRASAPRRRLGRWLKAAGAVAALAMAAAAAAWWARRAPDAVPAVRFLTYSGRDTAPAASPDARTIAFASRRDGRKRIWLKQLATGSEAPLTEGDDDHPRFSPDGSEVYFARTAGGRVALHRVPVVGGAPRKVVDDALYVDVAPDGRRIAFLRQQADADGMSSSIGLAAADGSGLRELARLSSGAFVHPRWSPDGRTIAATQSPLQEGEPTRIALVDAASGEVRLVAPPDGAGVSPGGLAWSADQSLLCSQPLSVVGAQSGVPSRILAMDVASRRARTILNSPANMLLFDPLSGGRLVMEVRTVRQNLRLVAAGGPRDGDWLTRGNSTDRQPVVSRDGDQVVFSSNRSGNIDLWSLSRRTGALRRLTDDPSQDWDPAFTPDGRILWSSNRAGHFEVWLAEADGAGARQLTRDGVDAENPVPTPDGRSVLYASGNPSARGIFRMDLDGTRAARVLAGNLTLPEVSPDGRFVAFVADLGSERATLRVARLGDGAATAFEVPLPAWTAGGTVDHGRSRWTPDGRSLAYVGRAGHGACAIFLQEFTAGGPRGPRRLLADLGPDLEAESLAFAPDGALVVSFREQLDDLMLAEGVPGVTRATR
jgi:Tol biopolymer transport system component